MSAPVHSTEPGVSAADTDAAAAAAASVSSSHRLGNADERRMQPHHAHDEPDATADSAPAATLRGSSSSGTAVADLTRPHHPISRLYRHALESILAFSDLSTLAAAVRVSKEWLGAVKSMRPLALKVKARPALVESLAASAIGRHVADLSIISRDRVSGDAMSSLARHMPQLRHLGCMTPQRQGDAPMVFPAGLRELHLVAFDPSISVADINAAIAAAGRLPQLETFKLRITRNVPLISFAPLAALPLLRDLWFSISGPHGHGELSNTQVAELRALPRLHYLHVHPPLMSTLVRLLAQPHGLQWQHISSPRSLSDESAALLLQLPTLTTLHFSAKYLTDFDFLLRLPNLASLHCSFAEMSADSALMDRMVAGLGRCTSITDLHLDRCDGLTAAYLADLLPRLTRLHSLTLLSLRVDSLSFLAQAPMTSQLSVLKLIRCRELPVAELSQVHSLRGLRELAIQDSFNERMEADCSALRALRLPSTALALLESFTYSASH